jgi:hypothetical protein
MYVSPLLREGGADLCIGSERVKGRVAGHACKGIKLMETFLSREISQMVSCNPLAAIALLSRGQVLTETS